MLLRTRCLLAVVLIPSAIVTIVTTRKDVVLASSEKTVGVAVGMGPRVVNEAKSV